MCQSSVTHDTHCVCSSSRLALLRVCWALTCPHAVRAKTCRMGGGRGIIVEKHAGKEVRQRRAAGRKRWKHVGRAHQREVTLCSMSMLGRRKRALRQSSEGWKEMCVPMFSLQKDSLDMKCTHTSRGLRPSGGRSCLMETRGQEIITHSDSQIKITRWVKPRHGKASVLLALVGQRQGLVFAGPLLAVIGDCGDTKSVG